MSIQLDVNKNDLDMLLLSMTPEELNFLKLIVAKRPDIQTAITINLADYYNLEAVNTDQIVGLGDESEHSKEKLFDAAVAVATKFFDRRFVFRCGDNRTYVILLSSFCCKPLENEIEFTLSDSFYMAIESVGFDMIAEMLEIYTNPPISNISRAYSSKLYLLLSQGQIYSNPVNISYADLREAFCIDKEAYALIQNFKRRLLDLAIADVNTFTDLNLTYEDITQGRKITHFKFINYTAHNKG